MWRGRGGEGGMEMRGGEGGREREGWRHDVTEENYAASGILAFTTTGEHAHRSAYSSRPVDGAKCVVGGSFRFCGICSM